MKIEQKMIVSVGGGGEPAKRHEGGLRKEKKRAMGRH